MYKDGNFNFKQNNPQKPFGMHIFNVFTVIYIIMLIIIILKL